MTTNTGNTAYRVNFACAVMLRYDPRSGYPNPTRNFDNCFENDDSDTVAAKVYRRALKNPRLMAALPSFLSVDSIKAAYDRLLGGASKCRGCGITLDPDEEGCCGECIGAFEAVQA